jgi:hypothetical protein
MMFFMANIDATFFQLSTPSAKVATFAGQVTWFENWIATIGKL